MSVDSIPSSTFDEDGGIPIADLDVILRETIDARRAQLEGRARVLRAWSSRVGAAPTEAAGVISSLSDGLLLSLWTGGVDAA